MKVLVIGGGGREHAIAWKTAQSPLVTSIHATSPGAGMDEVAVDIGCSASDVDAIVSFATSAHVGLVIVGPEAPLVAGVADALREAGVPVVGPGAAAARLEGSKAWAKEIMIRSGVPTAGHRTFTEMAEALAYAAEQVHPIVVKASGLAAGKGVVIAMTPAESTAAIREMMEERRFGNAGACVVIEECLVGEEVSLIALCSGTTAIPLASSQDHKRLLEGDRGPNTGGMGAYSPAPALDDGAMAAAMDQVITPILETLASDGIGFQGFLYAGLMMTADGPKVLEYNVRLGDPETQAILPRFQGDWIPLLLDVANGESLEGRELHWDDRAAVCVVMAAEGYPRSPRKGDAIVGLQEAVSEDCVVFHAGTRREGGAIRTGGGRVLGVTAWGPNHVEAVARAYRGVDAISFPGMQFRRDIAARALKRSEPTA